MHMTITEQRRYLRQETDIPITIYKDDEKIPATLIDISKGGIGLTANRGFSPGAKVDIMVAYIDDYSIHGTVRWVYQIRDGGKTYYRTGIEADRIIAMEDIVESALPERSGKIMKYKKKKMEEIVWDQHFSVGILKFDEEHKGLILMINRLISHSQATTELGLLVKMTQYAREHFLSEEKLMAQYDYPDREAHINQHRDFRRKTMDFCMALIDKEESSAENTLQDLGDWLVNHILKTDKAYSSFFQGHGVGQES